MRKWAARANSGVLTRHLRDPGCVVLGGVPHRLVLAVVNCV